MVDVARNIEIDLECGVCGVALQGDYYLCTDVVSVSPCEQCLANAHQEGRLEAESEAE